MKRKTLQELLLDFMAEAKVTQAKLVDISGIGKSTISDILTGKMGAQDKTIQKISEALRLSPEKIKIATQLHECRKKAGELGARGGRRVYR